MLIKGASPPREGQDALLHISSVLLCLLPNLRCKADLMLTFLIVPPMNHSILFINFIAYQHAVVSHYCQIQALHRQEGVITSYKVYLLLHLDVAFTQIKCSLMSLPVAEHAL